MNDDISVQMSNNRATCTDGERQFDRQDQAKSLLTKSDSEFLLFWAFGSGFDFAQPQLAPSQYIRHWESKEGNRLCTCRYEAVC